MTNGDLVEDRSEQEPACRTVRDQLALYATSVVLGTHAPDGFSDIRNHVESCSACRALLDELLVVTVAAYAGEIEAAPQYPVPNLSFLPALEPSNAMERPWRIDHLGRLIITFSQRLLEALQPSPLTGATRGNLLYQYVQEAGAVPAMAVTIDVSRAASQPGLTDVRVGVDLLQHDPLEQGGSRVELSWDNTTLASETDPSGYAGFTDVPLNGLHNLRVEITPRSL